MNSLKETLNNSLDEGLFRKKDDLPRSVVKEFEKKLKDPAKICKNLVYKYYDELDETPAKTVLAFPDLSYCLDYWKDDFLDYNNYADPIYLRVIKNTMSSKDYKEYEKAAIEYQNIRTELYSNFMIRYEEINNKKLNLHNPRNVDKEAELRWASLDD